MNMIHNKDGYVPSRDVLFRWLGTRKRPYQIGPVQLPGLFQTANEQLYALLFMTALVLELFGLYNLQRVGDIVTYASLGLFAADLVAALMLHTGRGRLCEMANRLIVTMEPEKKARLLASIPYWHGVVRWLGGTAVIALAAAKLGCFLSYVDPDTALGITLLVAVSYALVGLLHLVVTGWFLWQTFTAFSLWWQRLWTLRGTEDGECVIKGVREVYFNSPLALITGRVEGHELREVGRTANRFDYVVRMKGILLDSDVASFGALQRTAEQKAIVARDLLAAQLEWLGSSAVSASEIIEDNEISLGETRQSTEQTAPSSPALRPIAFRAVPVLTLGAMMATGLTSCVDGKKHQPLPVSVTTVLDPAVGGSSEMPKDLIDALAPSKPELGDGREIVPSPTLVRLDTTTPVSVAFESEMKPGFFDRLLGHVPDARRRLSRLRKDFMELTTGNPLFGPTDTNAPIDARLAAVLSESESAVVFAPGAEPTTMTVAGQSLVVCQDAAALRHAITTASGGKLAVICGLPKGGKEGSARVAVSQEEATLRMAAPSQTMALASRLASQFFATQGAGEVHTESREGSGMVSVQCQVGGCPVRLEIAMADAEEAFDRFAQGKIDFLLANRPPIPSEVKAAAAHGDLRSADCEHVLALDAVAVAVPLDSTVPSLTKSQIADIFSGQITRWEELGDAAGGLMGPIRLHLPDTKSTTAQVFADGVFRSGESRFGLGARQHREELSLVRAVAGDSRAIGFASLGSLGASVRALPIADGRTALAIAPSPQSVAMENYALTRRIYLYTPAGPTATGSAEVEARVKLACDFADFAVMSHKGQEIVEQAGFVSQNIRGVPIGLRPDGQTTEQTSEELEVERAIRHLLAAIQGREGEPLPQTEQLSIVFRFNRGSADLDARALDDVRRLAHLLRHDPAYAGSRVLLAGFADNTGSPETNEDLSRERAQSVKRALAGWLVEPEIVTGFGPRLPVASNDTPEGRSRNRRVEVWIRRGPSIAASGLEEQ